MQQRRHKHNPRHSGNNKQSGEESQFELFKTVKAGIPESSTVPIRDCGVTREERKHNAEQISLDQHPKIAALSCLPLYDRLVTA